MEAAVLFALPLVGGLIFCSTWNVTRWLVAREEGHRLYFRAVLFGAILFVVVAILHYLAEHNFALYKTTANLVKGFITPLAKETKSATAVADLSIICFFAMLAGWPLALLLNLGFRKEYWLRRAIKEDDLESFLLDAAETESSIAITMDDRKVYVGYVVEGYDPAIGRKCIFLLPLMSGYRDQNTHKVNFTTFYTYLYGSTSVAGADQKRPLPEPLSHLSAKDFITIIPTDRIVSYRLFDAPAYLEFQKAYPDKAMVKSEAKGEPI